MNNQMGEVSSSQTHYLTLLQRVSFSLGHVFNDLCAAFWFTYLLIFMHSVNGFSSETAGTLMLIGQVADGLATPFIGIECDRNLNWWICKYGRRKTWHLVGTICVLFSFPFLFNQCIYCIGTPEKSQIIYYAAFIVIFQFGWAAVQISHLSLIPDLTPVSSERVELNAFRYAATVFANITVYLLMWLVLNLHNETSSKQISVKDASTFREVSLIIIFLGCIFSEIFHIGTRERPNNSENLPITSAISRAYLIENTNTKMSWKHWFRESQFYKVGLLYMGTRLTINLTQVYIPNYLQETLYLPKKSVAYIPLVIYSSGFLSSFVMKFINVKLGSKLTYLMGSLLSLISCAWIFFGLDENFKKYEIFAVSGVIGMASSTMLITSLAITNDMIGQNTASGAFVFGAMSLVDKISNGIAVMIIENLKPCPTCSCFFCDYYYRNILTFVVGGSTALALIGLALLSTKKIGDLKNNKQEYDCIDELTNPGTSSTSPLLSSNFEESS